jgi:hypothetical protein
MQYDGVDNKQSEAEMDGELRQPRLGRVNMM